jgi:DNA-binding GntR family transcriptional regulator
MDTHVHPAPSSVSERQANLAEPAVKRTVLQQLRERILQWHYPPGHHLAEQSLCAEFSTSRIPIREALSALAEQGLVDKVPNHGCYVKQPDVTTAHQLFDLRLALELFVGESLAQQPLPPGWNATERAFWKELEDAPEDRLMDGPALVLADERFHLSLARRLGNPLITQQLLDINDRLRFVRLVVLTTPQRVRGTAVEHLSILDALEARDPKAVREALRRNIGHAREKVEMAISRALLHAHWRK